MSASQPPTDRPEDSPENIPADLQERDQWLLWAVEERDGDPTKVPRRADDPTRRASSTDPTTWASFEEAADAADDPDIAGIGFVFGADDTVLGIDLDNCRDADTGEVDAWAAEIVAAVDSFTEVSPSGTGLHIYAHAVKPGDRCRRAVDDDDARDGAKVEMYDQSRFFTVTGDHVADTPETVERRQAAVRDLYDDRVAEPEPEPADPTPAPGNVDLEDSELLDKARDAENGDRFTALFDHGDLSAHGGDHSRADLALMNHLAFWTGGDRGRMETLFGQSALGQRDKWRDRADYRERTIDKALQSTTDFYEPDQSKPPAAPDGGAAAATPDADAGPDPGAGHTWADVIELFESDANGSTMRGYDIAANLLDLEYTFVALRETDGVYFYDEEKGYYVRKGLTFVGELLEEYIPQHLNESRKRNIREKIRDRNYISSDEFQPPEAKVNVANGVLDLQTRELEPHSPDYYFTARVRAEWPENGEPDPRGEALWLRALRDATDLQSERDKIEEFGGYIFEAWHHDREKNMIFVGKPISGKSTVQEAIEALFGTAPTVSNLSPQQMADTKFDAARLREAMLNTVNDINATKVEDTGTLKRIWSGERTKMENKYEDSDFAAPTAKHLFTANWLPRLVGQDESLYRRMLIVEFVKSIPDSKKDRRYKKRLKAPHVRQAMLVRFVEALQRLNEQGHFTNDRPRGETRQLYDSWRDAHRRFLYTQFEITMNADDKVERDTYNRALNEYCARNGYAPVSRGSVTKTLQYVPGVDATGREDHYRGLTWRDGDAAEERTQVSLTQHARRRNVREWINELSDNDNGALHDDLLAKGEETGVPANLTESDIEHMLRNGEIYETADREYRTTSD